jgi:hypothetical protein
MIYVSDDGRQIRLSNDRTTAIIEKIEPVTQAGSMIAKNYDAVISADYREILTTPNMVRRALRSFGGDEVIHLGVSRKFEEAGAEVMKVRNGDKIVIMAGRAVL